VLIVQFVIYQTTKKIIIIIIFLPANATKKPSVDASSATLATFSPPMTAIFEL